MRRYSSGQRGETVNLLASAYEGSNPSRRTKIVHDVEEQICHYIETVDVTMNQIMVHDGQLYCTERALKDIAEGNIRACGGEKPLFGSDSVVMPDGNAYLFRNGFYRTLAMLLRNRGERIIVSQENIDAEKDNIGRYWLVLLFVKILKMAGQSEKEEAILQWHQVAKDIGSTSTDSPADFLKELAENNPEFSYFKEGSIFDTEAQTRWLIGKLVDQGRRKVEGQELDLPTSYTPSNIELRPYEGDSNLAEFWELLNSYTHNKS